MEVVDDTEPPLKRMKGLLNGSNGFLKHYSAKNSLNGTQGDPMACPVTSEGDEEMIGSKGVIRKSEFIRVITSALYSLGYSKTGALLEEESGVLFHSSMVELFLQQVMDGNWDKSVATLRLIGLSDENAAKSASFLLLEQKVLEFLKMENITSALNTLRSEIVPLGINDDRVRNLASSIVFGASGEGDQGLNSRSRLMEELEALLPASLIPKKRLEELVEQALHVQRDSCVFHNTADCELSLFSDHQCGRHQIPSQTIQTLESHNDEVWFLQFSHNGKYLASSSKDQSAIIWEVKEDGQVLLKHRLLGHQKPVITVSWSHDDSQILTCGLEEVVRCWDVDSGDCLRTYDKNGVGSISCGWFQDGKEIFAGMTDQSISIWDLKDGKEVECLKGQNVLKTSDMAVTNDGKRVISIKKEMTILLFARETRSVTRMEEEDVITSFSLSEDNKFLLVNLMNQEIHLWSIVGEPRIVSRYKGHKRSRFVIRSCLGGYQQAFVASGSEDSQVYIWHRSSGELLMSLPGHSGSVNCVSWSPRNLRLLASASDDHTIRIWGPSNRHFNPPNRH